MNKLTKRVTAIILCTSISLCCGGMSFAQDNKKLDNSASTKAVVSESFTQDTNKDETVYVLTGSDGSVQKVIVSDWIRNALESDTLADKSEINDVTNVKGNESYTVLDEDIKIWDAQGNDIYYQGSIEKEMPVEMTITYKLDGKTISPQELAGKSGKITIRFDYKNNQFETREISGEDAKIYVPFAVFTGMLLDNDVYRNLEINSGKLVNDGDHTIVIGLAFPGLQENLSLSRDKIDIPDYIEITADVTNFELGMTLTIATNELFSELDESKLDSTDDASASLSELTDVMTQLIDGSDELYNGLCTLLERSTDLVTGVSDLVEGTGTLQSGTRSLESGATELSEGADDLLTGLRTLSSNSSGLTSGATQVFNTLLSSATSQIRASGISIPDLTISNYGDVLSGVIDSLDENAVYNQALQEVTAAVEAQRDTITAAVEEIIRQQVLEQVTATIRSQVTDRVTTSVKDEVTSQVLETFGLSKEEFDAAMDTGDLDPELLAQIETAIEEQMTSDNVQAQIGSIVAEQMESDDIQATIENNTDTQMQSETVQATISDNVEAQIQQAIAETMASNEIQSQLVAASEGAKTIISLKTSLDSFNAFYLGLSSYTSGVDSAVAGAAKLASGASELKDGISQLNTGAGELYSGIQQLQDSLPALTDGITELRDGALALSDGLKEFNEQGIEKLVDLVNGDLETLSARLKATLDVSQNYRSFAGLDDNATGQVKFIYRTAEISA